MVNIVPSSCCSIKCVARSTKTESNIWELPKSMMCSKASLQAILFSLIFWKELGLELDNKLLLLLLLILICVPVPIVESLR